MSVSERKLKYNLTLAKYYYNNRNTDITFKDKSIEIIKKCYEPFISNLYHTLQNTSSDNIVELAEVAFTVSLPEIAENLIKIYFEQDSSSSLSKNSYYVRALLVKAMVDAKVVDDKKLKAEEAANALMVAVKSIQQGLDIIAKPENKQKYASTLYNASIITVNILKNYLKINWAKNFWEVFEKLSNLLEENDDVDFNWRIFILIKLAQCYIDADKKPEGQKALDKISDILKKKGDCDFMDELYRIRIHYCRDNSGALGNLKKEGESNPNYPQFKYLYTVQAIKSNIITEKDIDKEVSGVITALCPEFYKNIDSESGKYKCDVSIKIEAWKADVLAELAFAIMKFKIMLSTAYNLYYFLFQNGSNSLKGKIYLENIHSQKVLYDLEQNLKENAQPTDIVKQKRIEAGTEALNILDKNMSGCARLQDYNLINETSMLIFNTAIPFFKNPYRKIFYKAFYTACDQLEQISSNENYLRAAMHFELAKYYLEEDLLQEANTNLMKAMNNDYSLPINKIGGGAANATGNAKKGGATGKDVKEDTGLVNSINNNISYLQRNLEQYLVYLKRYIGVKVNIYEDPDNPIDKLIFEVDNVKNAKNEAIQTETINKCLKLINDFEFEKFQLPQSDKDFVEEEINDMKMKHDLKLYDDKKHFILICSELSKHCYKHSNYEAVLKIDKAISKYLDDLHNEKDVDQLIAISETKIECAKCYSEYLLEEGIEVCANNYANFNIPNRQYIDAEKEKFDEWRNNLYNCLQEACRIAVLANQNWLIFNVGITLWNFIKPMLDAPNVLSLINDNLINVFNDIFEALNNAMTNYESIGTELIDTDYYVKIDSFVSIASLYGRILEFKQKAEECIRICDIMLSRKLESRYRKIFDTLKAKASKAPVDASNAKKKAPAKPAPTGKKDQGGVNFVPTQDMTMISDCFTNLENAVNSGDDKTKLELLKKGIEMLKTYKINFHDESTLELSSELWYKHGVQFFSLKNNLCYKYGMMCADNCVKTYDNIDIANNIKRKNISLQLQKWYCLGFLLYGDCLLNLVNIEKQERLVQIQLYFNAVEKILLSAKIAEKAKQYFVILQDMKAFYSVVINVIDMPQNREKLCPNFLQLHQILINNKQGGSILYSDSEFLLLFFSLFCMCINETKNWELGEKIIGDAIKIIPNEFQHILLEHKLFYYSKQGKSFMQDQTKSSSSTNTQNNDEDKDVLTKAKLFTKLAKSSTNKKDQFNAYNRAVELLKNDQNIYVCNVMFELSSWLYKNNYPFKDVEENLNSAADILLEIEAVFDDEEEIDSDANDVHSKKSGSSRKSRLSKRSKSRKSGLSNKSKSKKKSSVSGFGPKSKASQRSRSRNYSSHTSKTKTIFAKMLDYDPYPLYMNLHHLVYLFQIQVFLSIVSEDYIKKQEYLLDGFFVLRKMIELSMKTMNCIEFYEKNKEEIISNGLIGNNNEVNPLMSLINNYYIAKDINIPQYFNIPETLDGWLIYEWPENFLNKIKSENENNASQAAVLNTANISLPNYTFFSKKSFEKPYQFFYYFNYLLDKFMNEYYFHSECLLLIKFGILYSKYILENSDMEYAFNLKYNRLVTNLVYNDPENPSSQNIYKNIKSLLVDNPKLTPEIVQSKRDELRKFDLKLNSNNEDAFLPTGPENVDAVIRYVDDFLPHISWIELASEYYKVGYFNFCKEYSEEALFHSLVLKDKDNFIKTNLLLANVAFIESNFDLSCKIFNKIQNVNQSPEMMFNIIRDMTYVFDYMNKNEELISYLSAAIEYFDSQYESVTTKKYSSSESIYYQMYSYSLINCARGLIKKYSENLKLNEFNIVKEQKSSMNTILIFFNEKIIPTVEKFKKIISKSSLNMYNIQSILDYILLSLNCLIKNNVFIYVSLSELDSIISILENCLTLLEDMSGYLNKMQTYIPLRMDNSLICLPMHRIIAFNKILYAIINNVIGEFKNRIKRENAKNEMSSIANNFKPGVKYNQEVIDYLNSLTTKINEMKNLDERDKIENMNRYEKSISLLISCESIIPKFSSEFILYSIEKINSYRLQSTHLKELTHLWEKDTLETIVELQKEKENTEDNPPPQNTESDFGLNSNSAENKTKKLEEKIAIQKFHQVTINLISEFEKNILDNEKYNKILRYHYKDLMKYYLNVIETTGYLNSELTFKALADYQNNNIKDYFNEVIKRYVNPKSRDWASFALFNKAKNLFSFDCHFPHIYNTISSPETLENFEKYLDEIPYYKNANSNFYSQFKELKDLLPNNSSYLIFQMNEDKSILYIGFMMILGPERKSSYYLKRIILSQETNRTFDNIIHSIKSVKYTLIKTICITKEELDRLLLEQNDKINKIVYDIENNFKEMGDIFNDLDQIINPVINDNDQNDNDDAKDKKNKKKPAAAAPTGGKKDKNQSAPSDLVLPTSNIEQITFLIDPRLSDIPFECFNVFNKIPYKSNDFSLNSYIMRLKKENFNPSTLSSISIPGNVKYYLDYFKEQEFKINIKESITNHLNIGGGGKNNPTSPLEGIISNEHKPSIAELQKLYMNSNTFIFTSQTALLYQFPYEIFDTSKYSNCKIGIIFDRIINIKNYVDSNSLTPKSFSFNNQPNDTIAMMTLCGVDTILTTRWSIDYDQANELLDDTLDEAVSKSLNLSYAINKYKAPKRVLVAKEEDEQNNNRLVSSKSKGSSKSRKIASSKKKDSAKKKDENVVLDETNSVEVKKLPLYIYAPTVFGLGNVKLV